MNLGRLPFAFIAGAALAVFGRVHTASACSLPACSSPLRIPAAGYLPGNLVYFEVTAEAPGRMTLRTEAGEPIAASIRSIGGHRVFAPDAPIAPETYVTLEYEESCPPDFAETPLTGTFEFWTTAFSSIVLQPARLFVREYGVAYPGVDNNELGFVRVGMDSPDVNASATHLMTHTVAIDGVPISSWAINGELGLVSIESRCRPALDDVQFDSCGNVWAVPVGPHTVSVQTRVLGYDGVIAPVTLDIETSCPGGDMPIADDGPVADEPTTADEPTGTDDSPVFDDRTVTPVGESPTDSAAADTAHTAAAAASDDVSDNESCAFGGGAASSRAPAGLALLALGLLARRRRARSIQG